MRKQEKSKMKIFEIVNSHIRKNAKEYLIASIIFLIGIVIGITFVNNMNESQRQEIKDYLSTFENCIDTDYKINTSNLLKNSIINNTVTAVALCFIGSTVIGMPIVYIIIATKGFSLGYAISSIMITYKIWKAIGFSLSSLLLQNIIIIPCLLALTVSGMKLHKSIIKDKRRENVKLEIVRHLIFSTCIATVLVISSLIEVYVSSNISTFLIKTL